MTNMEFFFSHGFTQNGWAWTWASTELSAILKSLVLIVHSFYWYNIIQSQYSSIITKIKIYINIVYILFSMVIVT